MGRYILWTRSFHPKNNFGLSGFGYEGDHRGFSFDDNVTSRIRHKLIFSIDDAQFIDAGVASDESRNWLTGTTEAYRDPALAPTSEQIVYTAPDNPDGLRIIRINLRYKGQNLALPWWRRVDPSGHADPNGAFKMPARFAKKIVPYLRVYHELELVVDSANGKMSLHSNIFGSGFPNCESYLVDEFGKKIFLATHVRFGSASGQLWFNSKRAMTHTNIIIDVARALNIGTFVNAVRSWDYMGRRSGPARQEDRQNWTSIPTEFWNWLHSTRCPSDSWSWLRDNFPFYRSLGAIPMQRMPPPSR